MDWESSTEKAFLTGETDVPAEGMDCTLVGMRVDEMPSRNNQNVMEQVFIATFAEPTIKDAILNKTNRKFLREQCGITNANFSQPHNIPLRLVQNHTTMGIGFLLIARPAAAPVAQPAAAPAPAPAPAAHTQPMGVAQPAPAPAGPPADEGIPF